ncbi:MAG: GtrA family protein [Clostridia bacterium]|nr:GtrA family protein [Clostridia bacterium]
MENKKDRFEFARFFFVGCLTTLLDMFVMGVILYLFDSSLYPNFYNVWFGQAGEPSTTATVIGTGVGFMLGIIASYLLSIFYVYKDKGNSRTLKGAVLFFALAIGGMALNMAGMWLGYDIIGINEWVTKIVMTLITLFYNYYSRKIFIFKKSK